MPYNGIGTFNSLGAPTFPAVPSTYILASYFNATLNDIFGGLSLALPRDGQAGMTANLPMGGFKLTGLSAGTGPGDSVNFAQAFTSPTFSDAVLTGVPTTPTAVPGTNTSQVASTAFVIAQAFSSTLPVQAGNAGKVLRTDGTNAAWAALAWPVVVINSNTTAVFETNYLLVGACTLTLPAISGSGKQVGVAVLPGVAGAVIAPNGSDKIRNVAGNMTVDNPPFDHVFTDTGATYGWA